MAKNLSTVNSALGNPYDPDNPGDPPVIHNVPKGKNYYFDNDKVEQLLYLYHETECTNVKLRDLIMGHASELIRQIIRAHNLQSIYPGREESSFGDLFQVAWVQIESVLYKYDAIPYCRMCYNAMRPSDSMLCDEFLKFDELVKKIKKCKKCGSVMTRDTIYYKGRSKVFNLWCVNPDTNIISSDGITKIKNVLNCNKSIYGINGANRIISSVRKPVRKTLKITTELGYQIECTPEHHLYKLGGIHSVRPEWVMAGDLDEGDLLGIQYSQQFFAGDDDISNIKLERPGDWNHPKKITQDLAYFFGLYLSEGSYGKGMVSIYNSDAEVINFLRNNKFGLKFGRYERTTANYACCQRFSEFLDKMGFDDCHCSYTKKIPDRLLRMSKKNIEALLSGLFDGDGHSSRYNGHVGYTSTSLELINQIRMLLLNIGILSKISKDDRGFRAFNKNGKIYESELKDAYQIHLSTLDSLNFYDRVGFRVHRKQDKMHKLLAPKFEIYGVSDKFRNLYSKYGSVGKYNTIRRVINPNNEFITISKASMMLKYWNKYSDDEDYKFIKDRIDEFYQFKNKIVWLPIRKIENSECEVCDIEVDSEDHSYIANGFISHNSQIGRTVILAYIKKELRDKKNYDNYQTHLIKSVKVRNKAIDRLIKELKESCKYSECHLKIVGALDKLCNKDDRPHEGLISKLVSESGMTRAQVVDFLKFVRLNSLRFSDSPTNDKIENIVAHKKEFDDEENRRSDPKIDE